MRCVLPHAAAAWVPPATRRGGSKCHHAPNWMAGSIRILMKAQEKMKDKMICAPAAVPARAICPPRASGPVAGLPGPVPFAAPCHASVHMSGIPDGTTSCVCRAKESSESEKAAFGKDKVKEDLEAKIQSLTALSATLTKEIAEAKKQFSITSTEIEKASQAREAQNAEFQTTVADQRATQTFLRFRLQELEAKVEDMAASRTSQQACPVAGLWEWFQPFESEAEYTSTLTEAEEEVAFRTRLQPKLLQGITLYSANATSMMGRNLMNRIRQIRLEMTKGSIGKAQKQLLGMRDED